MINSQILNKESALKFLKYPFYGILVIVILVTFFFLYGFFVNSTQRTGTIKLSGLHGLVVINRDEHGVPHIVAAKSDEDVFFALGFVHAQDRFWQMEFQRRIAQGTLSEIFGSATIDKDKFLRTWGFYRAAQTAWPAMNIQTQAIVHSYTQGVNAFLRQNKLPLQFKILHYQPKPWTDVDSIAWGKMMAFDLQNNWSQQINNYLIARHLGEEQIPVLSPPYPNSAPTILSEKDLHQSRLLSTMRVRSGGKSSSPKTFDQQLEGLQKAAEKIRSSLGFSTRPGKGSNNWVVTRSRSASGKPLLANDPHLALSAPALWYLAELRGPHLHVSGATIPGSPGVFLGHNDYIAWGATNVNPDTQDLYIEPNNAPVKIIHEIIKVKGEPDIDLPVRITSHGPIISDISDAGKIGEMISVKWTALLPGDTTLQSFLKIDYAKNWQEFVQALRDFVGPSQNFIFADIKGNIGYYLPGLIPLHKDWSGDLPVMSQQNFTWQGFVPFDQLPHAYNPSESILASANNKAVPEDYLYALTWRWRDPPYRIERIKDLLNAKPQLSVADFENMQLDTQSYLWRDLKPYLLKVKPFDSNSWYAMQLLQNWDGNVTLTSTAATVFAYWYRELLQMPAKQLGFVDQWFEPLFIKQQLASNGIYCRLNKTNTCDDYLQQTLRQAMKALTAELGNDPGHWQWSNIHQAEFKEQGLGTVKWLGWIWNSSIATPGGDETVNAGMYRTEKFEQNVGPGYRQVIDLSDLDHSLYIIAPGQDDNPFSEHHTDLMSLWRDGKYIKISSRLRDWGITEKLILEPAK